ncbi:MAG: DoxX family protein [Verrucomicrobiota bacterium]
MAPSFANTSPSSHALIHGGIFVLRTGLSATIFSLHGLPLFIAAWQSIWKKQPWDLVDTLTELQYPFPAIVSTAAALTLTIFPVSVFLGFLSRIASAILVVFLATVLVAANSLQGVISQEAIFLYLIGYSTVIVTGSGFISLDTAFHYRH